MAKVVITGIFGRMGQELAKLLSNDEFSDFSLIAGICAEEQLQPNYEIPLFTSLESIVGQADLVIDFTIPNAAVNFAAVCAKYKVPFITGTTGFSTHQIEILQKLAGETQIFASYNMSIGVAKFSKILAYASELLCKNYDVEILEKHHNQKVDAPSGTALMLGDVIARSMDKDIDTIKSVDRNHKRKTGEIGFASIRGGAIFGEHDIIFAGQNDIITLSHQALSRTQFAHGALVIGRWLVKQQLGKLMNMEDYLGYS